jgi:predicted RNase H-like HicB family nuclease
MRVQIQVEPLEDGGFVATVYGLSVFEGVGETPEEAVQEVIEQASLYLECKEPEMLEFEVMGGVGAPDERD